MDFVILLSVLPFSEGLNLLKEVGFSVIFVLFVLERFTLFLSGVFKLTTRLESTIPERILAISVSRKSDMSIKGSTVNQKSLPFLPALLKLEHNNQERYFPESALCNSFRLISHIINLILPKITE